MGAFNLLAKLTARLASAIRFDDLVDAVIHEISELGFAGVWMAVLDEETGKLSTLTEFIDGVDTTHEMPKIFALDMRQPIGHGFREGRMINIADPDSLHIIERDDDPIPPNKLGLPRVIHDHLRGRPFACGPLLGSDGRPVGALGLSSYHGNQPIPDALFSGGLVRAFMDHLGIAMERAVHVSQLDENLTAAQQIIASDAPMKAVGDLAAVAAHDLNNLAGFTQMAIDAGRRSPADAFDMLPRIERVNRTIVGLVARLLRIARVPASQVETAKLSQIVDDVLVMVTPILREKSIAVDFELPAVPLVQCDAVLVQQVVLNLLLNAHDALVQVPAEQRRISIRLRDDGASVCLSVADSGPGIPPQVFARLFEPYFTTKSGEHLGLGLASARESIQRFGGQLEARNAPTGGAVFEMTLVVAPSDAADRSEPLRAQPPIVRPARGIRILAIDDAADIVDIIRINLERHGYEVSTATSSTRAIELATDRAFDLVLCDSRMPEQNGVDVCRFLRSGSYRGKFILMTGWDSQALSAEERAAGCDALLRKPFGSGELLDVIQAMLNS